MSITWIKNYFVIIRPVVPYVFEIQPKKKTWRKKQSSKEEYGLKEIKKQNKITTATLRTRNKNGTTM